MNLQHTFVFDLFLTHKIMAILSKGWKPDNFELNNSLKFSFMNIQGLHFNFTECQSFLEPNAPDIHAVCEINLNDLVGYGNISVRGYVPLI